MLAGVVEQGGAGGQDGGEGTGAPLGPRLGTLLGEQVEVWRWKTIS